MQIVFIGAGNVASQLALGLDEVMPGCIVQIYSRTIEAAERLANKVNASATCRMEEIRPSADYYFFCLKDSILNEVAQRMPHTSGLWIHTAGSLDMGVLSQSHADIGVLYPLQTFSKERVADWKRIPLFIEANNADNLQKIQFLACQLSDKVVEMDSARRKFIHLSAVFACNFTNHMYRLAEQIVTETGENFEILLPLIEETCNKVHTMSPLEAQTGPAVRNDSNVLEKQMALIQNDETKEIYKLISESIYSNHNNEHN